MQEICFEILIIKKRVFFVDYNMIGKGRNFLCKSIRLNELQKKNRKFIKTKKQKTLECL